MHESDHEKLVNLISDIQFAMLTTVDLNGKLHSRPMVTLSFDNASEYEGTLWFFSKRESLKVHDIEGTKEVNISYSHPDKKVYVSVSGLASVSTDKYKMMELWKPSLKEWFPEGLLDPDLILLKIEVESAEFWDAPPGQMKTFKEMAKSLFNGKHYEKPHVKSHHLGPQ